MKEILIGALSGIVSGTGMGGGTVLILLLTIILGVEQHIAQATNLIFFIPTSIVAIITNWRHKLLDFKTSIIIIICGVIGSIIGAIISSNTNVNDLRKYFGIFLAIIAVFEIYSYFRKYIFKSERDTIKNKNKIF
jgi:uncharacterized membrane protein YfcA